MKEWIIYFKEKEKPIGWLLKEVKDSDTVGSLNEYLKSIRPDAVMLRAEIRK